MVAPEREAPDLAHRLGAGLSSVDNPWADNASADDTRQNRLNA